MALDSTLRIFISVCERSFSLPSLYALLLLVSWLFDFVVVVLPLLLPPFSEIALHQAPFYQDPLFYSSDTTILLGRASPEAIVAAAPALLRTQDIIVFKSCLI